MSFVAQNREDVIFWQASELNQGKAVHGFSTRMGGVSKGPFESMNLGFARGDDSSAVHENYERFCRAVGLEKKRLVCSKQVHEDNVLRVSGLDAGKGIDRERDYEADGLITNEIGLGLVIFSADCIPVLLHDPVTHAIGACHCGWRGTALGIAAKTVRRMQDEFGTNPADLYCAIGPGISKCCFETNEDVPSAMRTVLGAAAEQFIIPHDNGKFHVDLKGINRHWLMSAGVESSKIDVSGECTACNLSMYFSHRRTGNSRGSLAAAICLK